MIELRLYITGDSPSSERALGNVTTLIERELHGDCRLEVVDVLQEPTRAGAARILATPVLVRSGNDTCRMVGDLSDSARVLRGLKLA